MTIKEIAALAGVSISTVSKIVNNKADDINENTKNRVLQIVKEYNYRAYSKSKTIKSSKSFIIAILLRENSKPNLFLNGVIAIAQKNSYSVMIYNSSMDNDLELKNINSIIKNGVDGVIWEPIDENSLKHEKKLLDNNIKITYMNINLDRDCYFPNFFDIAYFATTELLRLGHTNIAYLSKNNSFRSDNLFMGFKQCLFDNNITFYENIFTDTKSPILENKILSHNITAILSSYDFLSSDIDAFISKIQYKLSKDISLISIYDDTNKNFVNRNYAGIKIPYYEFGKFICQKLIDKCELNVHTKDNFSYTYNLENKNSISTPFSSNNKNILVIGSINMDTTLFVDSLPAKGKTTISNNGMIKVGGKGANEAIGIAKLHNPVSLIGKIGNDYDANIIYKYMQENNIDTQGLTRDEFHSTGKAYIHLRKDGENTISILSGANDSLNVNDIDKCETLFKTSKYCIMQSEVPINSLIQAAKIAKKYNLNTVLKPAGMQYLDSKLIKNIDIFIPNLDEAKSLSKLNDIPSMAEFFFNLGPKIVIITLANKGAFLYSKEIKAYFDASDFKALDTTGGADAFISAFIVYLQKGYSLSSCMKIANYAAGFCVSKQGASDALISKKDMERYIKETNLH